MAFHLWVEDKEKKNEHIYQSQMEVAMAAITILIIKHL